ncbi:MAG: hypothetical protein H7247_11275 [Polaromonas sp.]|nr:hypothetical protein [Gemmatimonadaceae bacterium]
MPTNARFPLRIGCETAEAVSGRLTFNRDSSYAWEVLRQGGGTGGVAGTYVEVQPGILAIIGGRDTVRISGDTLRVALNRMCQRDVILAVAEG